MSLGQATKPRWAKTLRAWVSVCVTAGLLFWVVQRVDLAELKAAIESGNPWWWFAAVCLMPVHVVLGALRWQRVSASLELPMPKRRATEEYGLSVLLNQVLPGGISGDAIRVWRHKRGHGELGAPLRAALVDRVIGHWAHVAVTLVGVLLWSQVHEGSAPEGALPFLLVWAIIFAVLWAKPPPGMRSLVSDTRLALNRGTDRLFHAIISFALVGSLLLSFSLCALSLGYPLGWGALTAVPLLMFVMIVPVSVGGWGLRELSAVVILSTLGWSTTQAVGLSAAYGMASLVGATPFLFVLGKST